MAMMMFDMQAPFTDFFMVIRKAQVFYKSAFYLSFMDMRITFPYSSIENLVLWARSGKNGFATLGYRGVLEYWSIG
jgi:hypothetical protein